MQDNVQETDGEYHDTYTEVATSCIRYLDLTFEQIDKLTIPEYELMMNAYAQRNLDMTRDRYELAWLTVSAGATKKDGRPVYKKFQDFFDYESELRKLKPKPDKFSRLSKHLKEKEQCNRK